MVASEPSCISSEPSPSNTSTRRSGRASARPSPSDDAPPMKPTQATDRLSGAIVRQAGAVVMVGTQMALPAAAAMARSASSGLIATSDRLQAHQHRRRPAPLAAQAEVPGDQGEVLGPLQPGVGDPEGIQ